MPEPDRNMQEIMDRAQSLFDEVSKLCGAHVDSLSNEESGIVQTAALAAAFVTVIIEQSPGPVQPTPKSVNAIMSAIESAPWEVAIELAFISQRERAERRREAGLDDG